MFEPSAAILQPALLVRGLRRVALELGVRIHERTRVTRLDRRSPAVLRTPLGVADRRRVVIATNAWAVGLRELHTRLVVISSDMVATAPIPERLREIGWTRRRVRSPTRSCRSTTTAPPTTAASSTARAAGASRCGGRIGASFDRDEKRAREVGRGPAPHLPDARGRAHRVRLVGPDRPHAHRHPDLRPPRRARPHRLRRRLQRQRRRRQPSSAASILASLALGTADEWSGCGLVDGVQGRFPPEPVRFIGAHVVRRASPARRGPRRSAARRAGWPSPSRASRPRA